MLQRKQQHRRSQLRHSRRGASAVEFALIAPIMIAFTFGLVELGRIMLVKQTATHATREGARVAVRPTADTDEVTQRVNEELALWGIDNASVTIDPPLVESTTPGSDVTVSVSIDLASISWVPNFFDFAATDIVANSSMRRESTN